MKDTFLVVFKFDPRTAVRNDLREIFVAVALKENARAAVQLRDDNTLGTVDDESTVIRHQRDLAEENIFFLDIADRRGARFRILVIDRQPDLDLERHAVRHSAFLTLLLVMLVLQANRLTAVVAEIRAYGVERAAIVTEHFGRIERIDLDLRATVLTISSQVFEAFEVSALTLPVTDLILNIFEGRRFAKIGNREDR